MRYTRRCIPFGAIVVLATVVAGCGAKQAVKEAKGTVTKAATRVASSLAGGPAVKTARTSKFGTILVTSSGMTLYRLTTESHGKIACTGSCARAWPPLLVPSGKHPSGSGVSGLGTVKRPGGHEQVTYHGMPLYRYAADKKAGDTRGQGVGGVWFVVKLSGSATSKTTSTTSSSSSHSGYGY